MIKWREVTPLSRMLAIVLFVGAIPALFFYLGMQYQDTKETANAMRTYDFPRLHSFSGIDESVSPLGSTSTEDAPL